LHAKHKGLVSFFVEKTLEDLWTSGNRVKSRGSAGTVQWQYMTHESCLHRVPGQAQKQDIDDSMNS
jgi:hypothetical protein